MSIINVSNLSFTHEGSHEDVFSNVSFQIDTDWKLGFCGRNGRGKTTFLKLLMNEYEYSGTISSGVNFHYFPYDIADKARLTLEIFEECIPDIDLWEIIKELSLLSVDEEVLYRNFDTLSNGEQTKVLLCALFLNPHSFLLIDEPTNHLDIEARRIVAKYLKSKSGFILVSHDRLFLDECVDHILSINKESIKIISGNFSVYWEERKKHEIFEATQNEKLTGEIDRLKIAAAKNAKWAQSVEKSKYSEFCFDRGYVGHKSAKMMKRAKSVEKRQQSAINEKMKLQKDLEICEDLKLKPLIYHSEKITFGENISINYGDKNVCKSVNFSIIQGSRTAICGKNGSGKSSLLKLIGGDKLNYSGNFYIGNGVKISYVGQDASYLSGTLRDFAKNAIIDETLFFTILFKFDFPRSHFDLDMSGFSEGQKKKVLLASSLCSSAHLYIWDEPLNYIDVFSRMQIEELILKYCPTLLFVEHDKVFCDIIATDKIFL